MSSHAERLAGFGAAILDARLAAPPGLLGPDGQPSARRFAVYRNNVVVGLTEALQAAYPVVHRLVGEAFFRAVAGHYVRLEPPASPILLDYGAGFPAFLEVFPPAQALAYLPDVARLERAWVEAYHAAEPGPAPGWAGLPADGLAGLRLALHPSVRVLASDHPVLRIWQMNLPGAEPGPLPPDAGPDEVMLARPEAEVEVFRLPVGGAAFVAALQAGKTVSAAALAGFDRTPRFALQEMLSGLMASRACLGPLPAQPPHPRGDPRCSPLSPPPFALSAPRWPGFP